MERKYNIDTLRIISAIAVIIIHIVSSPISNNTVKIDSSLFANLELIHTLMNWSVPVFFMITGYCLSAKKECSYNYCFSHIVKYIGVLFTVGLFYALLEEVFVSNTINISVIFKSILNVIKGNLWDHMWFVYTIIGIYLVMPAIHNFLHLGSKNAFILTGLLFFFNILLPSFKDWVTIGIDFPFSGHLFYVCFGAIIAKYKINKKTMHFIYLSGLLSTAWIVGFNIHGISYQHLAICFMAMSIFLIFSKINIKANKWIFCIAQCTWGIYLIHPFFINVAIKLLHINVIASLPYIKLPLFAIVVFLLSLGSTCVLRKIPYIKKLF